MQVSKFTAIIIVILLISACTASKRSTKTTTVAPTPKTSVTNTPTNVQTTPKTSTEITPSAPAEVTFPLNPFANTLQTEALEEVYAPRKEELAAIQQQFPKVTMEKLMEGYDIYTRGACTNCHKPQSIYKFNETQWKAIIIDMAQKARMSEEQEEEVYQYVLSIKATQNK